MTWKGRVGGIGGFEGRLADAAVASAKKSKDFGRSTADSFDHTLPMTTSARYDLFGDQSMCCSRYTHIELPYSANLFTNGVRRESKDPNGGPLTSLFHRALLD